MNEGIFGFPLNKLPVETFIANAISANNAANVASGVSNSAGSGSILWTPTGVNLAGIPTIANLIVAYCVGLNTISGVSGIPITPHNAGGNASNIPALGSVGGPYTCIVVYRRLTSNQWHYTFTEANGSALTVLNASGPGGTDVIFTMPGSGEISDITCSGTTVNTPSGSPGTFNIMWRTL